MPYIKKEDRLVLRNDRGPITSGELNYLLTTVIKDYTERNGLSYDTINDVIGALEGAKLEYYRRVATKYEDHKIIVNGDVY